MYIWRQDTGISECNLFSVSFGRELGEDVSHDKGGDEVRGRQDLVNGHNLVEKHRSQNISQYNWPEENQPWWTTITEGWNWDRTCYLWPHGNNMDRLYNIVEKFEDKQRPQTLNLIMKKRRPLLTNYRGRKLSQKESKCNHWLLYSSITKVKG